ncbi:hypothetical protein Pfo_008205 [Paulownia fortunei]|nr:hypothetical protein Pfo_008205 [Paulownia fortunei]
MRGHHHRYLYHITYTGDGSPSSLPHCTTFMGECLLSSMSHYATFMGEPSLLTAIVQVDPQRARLAWLSLLPPTTPPISQLSQAAMEVEPQWARLGGPQHGAYDPLGGIIA